MPQGEDEVRKKYFKAGVTHPNRRQKRKTGFEGNNWPSTRTFYSDIPLSVVKLSKEFQFFVHQSGLYKQCKRQGEVYRFLEKVSKENGHYVSNYTINGMLLEKYGVRHNPTPRTQLAITKLIEWLKRHCKEMGVYKPFSFKFDKSDLVNVEKKKTQPTNEKNQN